jgi:hypothetical protein
MAASSSSVSLSDIEILKHFKENVIKCLDNLIELFPYEKSLITFRVLFETGIPVHEVMKLFAGKIIPLGKMIRAKSNVFFLDEKRSFRVKLGMVEIPWKTMWQSKHLDQQDRNSIWDFMNLFLGLAQMYSKNQGWNLVEEPFEDHPVK